MTDGGVRICIHSWNADSSDFRGYEDASDYFKVTLYADGHAIHSEVGVRQLAGCPDPSRNAGAEFHHGLMGFFWWLYNHHREAASRAAEPSRLAKAAEEKKRAEEEAAATKRQRDDIARRM